MVTKQRDSSPACVLSKDQCFCEMLAVDKLQFYDGIKIS